MNGITVAEGLSDVSAGEAEVKRPLIAMCRQVVAVLDATKWGARGPGGFDKFGRVDLTTFARIDQISRVFVDSALNPEWIEQLKRAGMALTICKEDSP